MVWWLGACDKGQVNTWACKLRQCLSLDQLQEIRTCTDSRPWGHKDSIAFHSQLVSMFRSGITEIGRWWGSGKQKKMYALPNVIHLLAPAPCKDNLKSKFKLNFSREGGTYPSHSCQWDANTCNGCLEQCKGIPDTPANMLALSGAQCRCLYRSRVVWATNKRN